MSTTQVQTRTVIHVKDLKYTYPDGHQALKGVSLRVEKGERIALVGPNGAGKSTLMLHLNGIMRAAEGDITVVGLPLSPEHVGTIRAKVGLVFQDPDDQLFSLTVYDDVAFGPIYMGLPLEEVDRRVWAALEQVGMTDYARRMPHHLSAGEKKRVSVATVLSMHPEILVLDEPAAGLDPRARRSLISLLASLPQTMVVSSH
ncbi:MAG: ATP-binding cassette domain-containing protein, partial [Chloroflexota bacterium]